jgi:hypothetical protein
VFGEANHRVVHGELEHLGEIQPAVRSRASPCCTASSHLPQRTNMSAMKCISMRRTHALAARNAAATLKLNRPEV